MKKLLSIFLVLVLILFSCAFAAEASDSSSAYASTDTYLSMKVGISIPSSMKDRWPIDQKNLVNILRITGYPTVAVDTGNQAADIHTMINDGADILIVTAEKPEELIPALQEAAEKNIPVIAYDRPIDSPAVTCFVSYDSFAAGTLQGEFIRNRLDLDKPSLSQYYIELTSGNPDDPNAAEIYRGIMSILKPYFDSGKLRSLSGQTGFNETSTPGWSSDKAAARAKDILDRYYTDERQPDIWLCPSDTIARSVTKVLSDSGYDPRSVLITGADGDADSLRSIRSGTQSMTVYKNLFFETYLTVHIAYAISIGVPLDEKLPGLLPVPCVFRPGYEINGKQIKCPSYYLTPVSVTADNLPLLLEKTLYTYDKSGYLRVMKDTGSDLIFTDGSDAVFSKVERSGVLDANDYMFRLINQVTAIRKITDFKPDIAIVLGSGLGEFADSIDKVAEIGYSELPDFPISSVSTHEGKFIFGTVNGIKVVCMKGRVHYYEGYEMSEVVMPIRLMGLLGASILILSNSAGGIRDDLNPGDFMLITDHIATHVPSPLRGVNLDMFGTRFQDMSVVYDKELRDTAKRVAASVGIPLKEGVYLQDSGPQYETPTEVQLYKREGADAVGMSTACEAIAARHIGMRVCGISFISNKAAGLGNSVITDEEVVETANSRSKDFKRFFTALIPEIYKVLEKSRQE